MDDTGGNSYFEFCAKFCNELNKTKNCVFSPLMVAEITRSANALSNIVPVGDIYSDADPLSIDINILSPSSLLSSKLKSIKGVIFNRTSKVYLNLETYKLDRKQKKEFKKSSNVKIKNIDFSNSDSAVDLINKGVDKNTKGKIKDFFKYNDFAVNAKVIFVSGLHFKGLWHMKFDPDNTEETIFHLNNNETVNVFLMYRKEKYKYKDSSYLEAQLLLLPFKDEAAHMLVVLPKRVTGLNSLLQKLADGYDIMAEVAQMTNNVDIEVSIPRFKMESEINLAEVLLKLGIPTIFDKAVQKVRIDVNEEGTEPKPVRMKCGFIPRWKPRPVVFTADRPHLIVIVYERIPLIWVTFRGRFE